LGGGYVTPAFGEAHNHNIPSADTQATLRTYRAQGIFYVMIQGNEPQARQLLGDRINHDASVDVLFAMRVFTSPADHPSGLVEWNIRDQSMTAEDCDGGFHHPVVSISYIDRVWLS